MTEWFDSIQNTGKPAFLAEIYYPCTRLTSYDLNDTLRPGNGPDAASAQAAVIAASLEEFPQQSAVFTAIDMTLDAEAFGCEVLYQEGAAPITVSVVVNQPEDVYDLEIPGPDAGRQPFALDVIKKTQAITDKPVFGVVAGPFTLAGMLMRYADVMMATVKNPEELTVLVEKATAYLKQRITAMKEAGADGVFICEPSAGMIPPKHRKLYSSIYLKQIVDAVQDDSFLCLLHNCGRLKADKAADLFETGVKVISTSEQSDILALSKAAPEGVMIMGNIDPLFMDGATEEEIEEATRTLLDNMKDIPNFILAPGCDIAFRTPLSKVHALADALN